MHYFSIKPTALKILLFSFLFSLATCSTKSPEKTSDPKLKKKESELLEKAKAAEAKGQTTPPKVSVCDRTEAIKQAIMKKLEKTDCATIKAEHLKSILFLDLSRSSVATPIST